VILLLGVTGDDFGGSEWAYAEHGHLGGTPPLVDLDRERSLAVVLVEGSRQSLLESAHDLSDGGLAQALVESCLRRGAGARVTVPGDPFTALFSESTARALVGVRPDRVEAVTALARQHGVQVTRLGAVTADGTLTVDGILTVPLAELREAHESTLPRLFD